MAAVASLDDLSGDGADKGIERLAADRVDDVLPTLFGSRPVVARRSASTASSLARICGPPRWSGRLRAPRAIFVAIGPGHSTETPTFVPASSCSSASESERTAYLLIEYGPWSVPRRF